MFWGESTPATVLVLGLELPAAMPRDTPALYRITNELRKRCKSEVLQNLGREHGESVKYII